MVRSHPRTAFAALVLCLSMGVTADVIRYDQIQPKVVPLGRSQFGSFVGASVAISGDGTTAAIGSTEEGMEMDAQVGGVFIYTKGQEDTTWTQSIPVVKITGSDTEGVTPVVQGAAVSLSFDGNVLVSTSYDYAGKKGAAWIFERGDGATFQQKGNKLQPATSATGDEFGSSAVVCGDGKTILIGAPGSNEGVGGTFVVLKNKNNDWSILSQPLSGTHVDAGRQGSSLACSYSGEYVTHGGWQDEGAQGSIWVFRRKSASTSYEQYGPKLNNQSTNFLGQSIAMSADGRVIVAGAESSQDGQGGCVLTFMRSDSGYRLLPQMLVPRIVLTGGIFSKAVAMNAQATRLVVGAPGYDGGIGGAFLFTREEDGEVWEERGDSDEEGLFQGSGYNDGSEEVEQGGALGMSSDGQYLVMGGLEDDWYVGAVWFYRLNEPPTPPPTSPPPTGAPSDSQIGEKPVTALPPSSPPTSSSSSASVSIASRLLSLVVMIGAFGMLIA